MVSGWDSVASNEDKVSVRFEGVASLQTSRQMSPHLITIFFRSSDWEEIECQPTSQSDQVLPLASPWSNSLHELDL